MVTSPVSVWGMRAQKSCHSSSTEASMSTKVVVLLHRLTLSLEPDAASGRAGRDGGARAQAGGKGVP